MSSVYVVSPCVLQLQLVSPRTASAAPLRPSPPPAAQRHSTAASSALASTAAANSFAAASSAAAAAAGLVLTRRRRRSGVEHLRHRRIRRAQAVDPALKPPQLQGGRPCGACGQLSDAAAGHLGAGSIFYCADCWTARQSRQLEAEESARSIGYGSLSRIQALTYVQAEANLGAADLTALQRLLNLCPDIAARRGAHGRTLLHLAAAKGTLEAVRSVVSAFGTAYGAHVELAQGVELLQDDFGMTAAEYAFAAGNQDVFDALVDSASERPRASNFSAQANREYVKQKLKYEGDVLYDAGGGGVMMGWEEPLMEKHAEQISPYAGAGQAVLNVGFGLGLVDGFLDARQPAKHVICEAHPDVYAEIKKRGWPEREGVEIIHGRWQDVAAQIVASGPFDGVYFDTYCEMYGDMQGFFALLPRLLKTGGRFSFFNGLSSNNIFAQALSCRAAQVDLSMLGLVCVYEPVTVGDLGDAEWRKVVNTYWQLDTYYSPLAVLLPPVSDMKAGAHVDVTVAGGGPGRSRAVKVGDSVGHVLNDKLQRAADAGAALF